MHNSRFMAFLCALSFTAPAAYSAITVKDDADNIVTLQAPAKRIISLSPHVTELIFAAGAGDKIIATVSYSDYPAAAREIPRIGDNLQLDVERILALKPDLVVAWMHGGFERQLEPLRHSGIPFFLSDPPTLDHIPVTLLKFGTLFGTEKQADDVAQEFRQKLAQLSKRYQRKSLVRTFYQVWGKPLYTLNDRNIASDVIRTCGGENIFGRLAADVFVVSTEAVLLENPELILGSDMQQGESGVGQWKTFTSLLAVRNQNLVTLNDDQLNRAGPRIIEGARVVCEAMELARNKRLPLVGAHQ